MFAFVLLAAFILFSPVPQQVFGASSPLLRGWTMYDGYGINICTMTLHLVSPEGKPEQIDWLKILGFPHHPTAPLRLRRITGPQQAFEIAAEVKSKLPSGSDLRMTARVSTLSGWMEICRDFPVPAP